MVKNKSMSFLWELNSIFIEIFCEKLYFIDPQHGHLVTWLQTKNTSFSPNELSVNQSTEEIRRVEYKISEVFKISSR